MAEMYEEAEKDYIAGMKYKEIAEKYNVSINTVKSWKTRYDWIRGNKKKQEKKCAHKNEKSVHTKIKREEPEEEPENIEGELTERMQLFCIYFVKYFNATKAYQKAYGCSYNAAASNGYKLLKKAEIKAFIDELKKQKLESAMFSKEDLMQQYIDIARADMHDFAELDESGTGIVINRDFDGMVVSELKKTKYGLSIKLNDRMKAMDKLGKMFEEQMSKAEEEEEKQKHGVVMLVPVLEEEDECNMESATETDEIHGAAGV